MFIGIFILNFKGDLVYAKPHREEMTKFILDLFRVNIIDQRGTTPLPPVNRIDKYNYIHMTLNDGLYIMGVIHNYANIIAALEFLKTIKNIIKYICGTVNETAISNKRFILVEILQETCSYGFPQITDLSVLKEWVFETIAKKSSKKSSNSSITNQITGQITWRKQGLKYSTHSLFLSVFEKVNVVVSATGILSTLP
uniref:AP-2 complex subunit mu (Trinotate prediction) n=1 Tax=Henneguya salminicola TaxID=69463 RepID=A0A6G3MFE2_HENSL